MSKKLNIGLLTTSPAANKKLIETIEARGHTCKILNPEKLYLYISEHQQGYDRFYIETEGAEPERIHAKNIDAVIPRLGASVTWGSAVLRFLTENLGIYCYNSAWGHIMAGDKGFTLQRLSSAGIRVPRTIICESPAHVAWAVEKLGMPIIIKTTHGSKGKTVGIVDSARSANSMFEFCFNAGLKCLLEEYIDSGSTDYRVWVVGDRVAVTMKRTAANKNEFKANVSLGGRGEKAQLSEEDEQLCIKAAQCLGLGVAGVDLMKHKDTGQSYVIEANSNPGTKVIEYTGHNVFEDVVKLVEDNCKKAGSNETSASISARHDLLMSVNLMSNIDQLLRNNEQMKTALIENLKVLGKSL
ncbi:MAG: RimK family alpha-L-glutamate ligase [Alphaproteobacteria bacterium]|nr:RimK family alpha-L-glutamate ligase [Alphaproteobacteria bacterium]